MNAIILCGGLSTRLGSLTKDIPKVLLPVGDRTVLDWQLDALRKAGIDTVVLAAGHLSQVLRDEVGEERNGCRIVYTIEPERLGTGGAIKYALQSVPKPDEPTFILNGDIMTTLPYLDIAKAYQTGSDGVILATRVEDASSYGTLLFGEDHHLDSFKEKEGRARAGYINGGAYFFSPGVKEYFPAEKIFSIEYDVFPHMKNLFVYPSLEPWVDVGVPERLAWAREHWKLFL